MTQQFWTLGDDIIMFLVLLVFLLKKSLNIQKLGKIGLQIDLIYGEKSCSYTTNFAERNKGIIRQGYFAKAIRKSKEKRNTAFLSIRSLIQHAELSLLI